MDDQQFLFNLKYQPSIKLLRSDNAPLIIAFLQQTFKKKHRMSISLPELSEKLEAYLEELNEQEPNKYPRSPQNYLKEWSDDEHRFIRIYHPANSDVPLCELTANTEKVIDWVDSLKPTEFIGTESRFLQIFSLLEDISYNTVIDIDKRLLQLEEQKALIQLEIDRIIQGGIIERYSTTQIKERFLQANSIAQEILRDFAQIEDIFRKMARRIHIEQLEKGTTKGKIVENVLIADTELKESDQGKSFYTFWEFLVSPSKKDKLRNLIESASELSEIHPLIQENPILQHIISYLINAGHKVMQSNSQLAERLRKLLDDRNIAEGRRISELITDIKQLANLCIDNPPDDDWMIEIEGDPSIHMPMERPLWEKPDIPLFTIEPIMAMQEPSTDVLDDLYSQHHVNEEQLRQNIQILLMHQKTVSLTDVVNTYPIQHGLAELIAYFNIASDNPHSISTDQTEIIAINTDQSSMIISVPRIVFRGDRYEA